MSLALSCAEKRVFALLLSWLLSGSQNGESVVPEANSAAMHGHLNNNTPVNTEVLLCGWVSSIGYDTTFDELCNIIYCSRNSHNESEGVR
jgi:hypothetical protein